MQLARWLERLALREDETIVDRLLALSPEDRQRVLRDIPRKYLQELDERWYQWAHAGQREPPGDWPVWLIRAGRGFGKTRAGSEWISEMARRMPGARIALVAANENDGMRVMIEGPSGLLAVARADETPQWRYRLTHPTAAALVARGALTGLSFGYRVTASRGNGPRELLGLDLAEVSLVAAPMQPLARVIAVDMRAAPDGAAVDFQKE